MKRLIRYSQGIVLLLLAPLAGFAANSKSVSSPPQPATACAAPQYRQFDFWIGKWDVYDIDNPKVKVAHATVNRLLDGCVLLEKYDGEDGSRGESFSIYDASIKRWRQSWVTNRGKSLVIEGEFQAGEMVLTGMDRSLGVPTLVRGVWKPAPEGVRETAARSIDHGKNWQPWFDLIFRPAATSGHGKKASADAQ